jgi:hypothetical protein
MPEDVAVLHASIEKFDQDGRVDLVLNTDGGRVHAARHLAEILREHTRELCVLVPRRARSAGTLLCLAADELILGPVAELGPLDAIIQSGRKSAGGVPSVSAVEIQAFLDMAGHWGRLDTPEGRIHALTVLSQHFSPSTLGAFYRADRYVRKVGRELLRYHLPDADDEQRDQIVDRLIAEYPEHRHSLTYNDLKKLNLRVRRTTPQETRHLEDIWSATQRQMGLSTWEAADPRPMVNGLLLSTDFAARHVYQLQGTTPTAESEMNAPNPAPRADIHMGWIPYDAEKFV